MCLEATPLGKREAQGLSRLSGGLFFEYFLLRGQKQVLKEKATRQPREPLRFSLAQRGRLKAHPCTSDDARDPSRAPTGLSVGQAAMLSAAERGGEFGKLFSAISLVA